MQTITFTEEIILADKFDDTLFCSNKKCKGNSVAGTIESVFLSHVNCEAKNPFWDDAKGKVVIPGSAYDGNFARVTISNELVGINHWEIGMLREIKYDDTYSHMWFPLMLFWAIARCEDKKGFGSMIALVGDQGVGKTVLAMQATDRQGYIRKDANGRRVDIGDYIFSRFPEGAEANPLFETLYLRQLLYDDSVDLFRPVGTRREPGDLKAVFFRPSQKLASNTYGDPAVMAARANQRVSSPLRHKFDVFARRLGFSHAWELIVYSIKSAFSFGMPEMEEPKINRSFWYTAVFYDTAGEGSVKNSEILRKVLRYADKVAILVNAEEIFTNIGKEQSIRVAHARLDDLRKQNSDTSRCLVVTQMDKVINKIGKDVDIVLNIAENLDGTDEQTARLELDVTRKLLCKYLGMYNTPKKGEFALDLSDFEQIFFMWTRDLPPLEGGKDLLKWLKEKEAQADKSAKGMVEQGKMIKLSDATKSVNAQPESYGLAKFICWCLDIHWSDINQI
jgi:hypothetical protein